MEDIIKVKDILDENAPGFIVEYRGDFQEEIKKVQYAYGNIITKNLAIVAVPLEYRSRLRKDVPSITFIAPRSMYILQDISPSSVDSINAAKVNPYLNLTGNGVLVGMVDSGIDYLNDELINEDGTSRIVSIWDQTSNMKKDDKMYIGRVYDNSEINEAIKSHRNGGNPYDIVDSKDEEYHGTKMAGIIGARGYNPKVEGVANGCDFVVVKLLPSPYYKKLMLENNLPYVPLFNNSEVLAAVEYLRKEKERLKKPMVIYFGVGSQEASHDGSAIMDRYITSISNRRGLVFVTGTGNSASDEGHVSGFIKNKGNIDTVELVMSREMNYFRFAVWIQKPNKMSLRVTSPNGESSRFLGSVIEEQDERNFLLTDTKLMIESYNPENYTGHQVFALNFYNIKSGIWKLELRGDYVINGRYDIWLPNKLMMAPGIKFLQSTIESTLSIPSTAINVVTVSYYNEATGSIASSCGRGFNTNGIYNPDISTAGINILCVSKERGKEDTISGSSAATAIVAGVCAILLQWGIVNGHDTTMNSSKVRSLIIYGGRREKIYEYPNPDYGYGKLNLMEILRVLGGDYIEYSQRRIYIRMPSHMALIERR